MAKLCKCECGFIVRGETDEIEKHLRSEHPDLAGKVSRDDLSGMIEEA